MRRGRDGFMRGGAQKNHSVFRVGLLTPTRRRHRGIARHTETQMEGHAIPHHQRSARIAVSAAQRSPVRAVRTKKADSPVRKASNGDSASTATEDLASRFRRLSAEPRRTPSRALSMDSIQLAALDLSGHTHGIHSIHGIHGQLDSLSGHDDATSPVTAGGTASALNIIQDGSAYKPSMPAFAFPSFAQPAYPLRLRADVAVIIGSAGAVQMTNGGAPPTFDDAGAVSSDRVHHLPALARARSAVASSSSQSTSTNDRNEVDALLHAVSGASTDVSSPLDAITTFSDPMWGASEGDADLADFGLGLFSDRFTPSTAAMHPSVISDDTGVPAAALDDDDTGAPYQQHTQRSVPFVDVRERAEWLAICKPVGPATAVHHHHPGRTFRFDGTAVPTAASHKVSSCLELWRTSNDIRFTAYISHDLFLSPLCFGVFAYARTRTPGSFRNVLPRTLFFFPPVAHRCVPQPQWHAYVSTMHVTGMRGPLAWPCAPTLRGPVWVWGTTGVHASGPA